MEIVRTRDEASMSDEAARRVLAEIGRRPDLVLGLATGATPLGLYERLRLAPAVFAKVRFLNLDEFCGLHPTDPRSFRDTLHRHLLDHVTHAERNVHLLRGEAPDPEDAARRCEATIRSLGGIDLQILGIGENGHVAFNEPGTPHDSRTRRVPRPAGSPSSTGLTMGLGTILESKQILLLASGAKKADAVQKAVEGPVTEAVPASCLQRHPRVTLIVDAAAAWHLNR